MEMKRKLSVKNANGVKEFHYQSEVNESHRKSMEDNYFVADRFLDNCAKSTLFGVFDGHGTSLVSLYLSQHFAEVFKREYINNKKNVGDTFKSTFLLMDNKLRGDIKESEEGGSTGTVGLILIEESQRVLYVAHVGDSSAFLFDDKGGQNLTPEHRPSNPDEKRRIAECNGSIIMNRVGGVLAVTRAFGDFHLKKIGLTVMPALVRVELRLNHRFLVVASDGLWDYITGEEAFEIVKSQLEVEDIAKTLIKKALKNGSTDNISVVVLKL